MASLQASLESMNASEQSLKAELGTALLSTLSSDDQHEVDRLNDEIQELMAKNRRALEERVKVCCLKLLRFFSIYCRFSITVLYRGLVFHQVTEF